MKEFDNYFFKQSEPNRSCLLALRDIILSQDKSITPAWKYGMPMFCYRDKMFCYLWIHKKYKQPYIGIVEGKRIDHPSLIQENRARMKIMLIDPKKDIPIKTVKSILKEAMKFYKWIIRVLWNAYSEVRVIASLPAVTKWRHGNEGVAARGCDVAILELVETSIIIY